MGLFDDLFSAKSQANSQNQTSSDQTQAQQTTTNVNNTGSVATSGNQSSATKQDTSQKSTQGTTQNQVTKEDQNVVQNVTTSNLDPSVTAFITNLLPQLAANATNSSDADAIRTIAKQLQASAGTPAVSAEDIAGQQSAAKTNYNNNEAVDIGRIQQSIGSKNNTYATQVEQKGQTDLSSVLAGIVANANIANKQSLLQSLNLAGSQFANASAAEGQPLSQLLAAITALKGATSTTTGGTTTSGGSSVSGLSSSVGDVTSSGLTTEDLNTLQQVISQSNQTSDQQQSGEAFSATTSNTTGKQSSNNGIIPTILSLF